MIASLRGQLASKSPESAVIEIAGVGYQVFIPLTTYYRLPELKEPVYLHIHTHVREDVLQLYGFASSSEKELFLLLISVSGVGPKLACNILSGMEVQKLADALRQGSIQQLRSIPGIGPKMAGRLVLELKDKVSCLDGAGRDAVLTRPGNSLYDDALSALTHLGYPEREAKQALDRIRQGTEPPVGVEEFIKQALRLLSKVS